jgi:hypothetical protein
VATYRLAQIAVDCRGLDTIIAFGTAALGYELDHRGDGYVVLTDPDARAPNLFFQEVPGNEFCVGTF